MKGEKSKKSNRSKEKVAELLTFEIEGCKSYQETKDDDVDEYVEADQGICRHITMLMLCYIRVSSYDSLISTF